MKGEFSSSFLSHIHNSVCSAASHRLGENRDAYCLLTVFSLFCIDDVFIEKRCWCSSISRLSSLQHLSLDWAVPISFLTQPYRLERHYILPTQLKLTKSVTPFYLYFFFIFKSFSGFHVDKQTQQAIQQPHQHSNATVKYILGFQTMKGHNRGMKK